jgi:hypothetical protein
MYMELEIYTKNNEMRVKNKKTASFRTTLYPIGA